MRDNQVDRQTKASVGFIVDMRPTTLLEQNRMRGYDRTTKPVGVADAAPETWESTGSRGATDYIAAQQLGIDGRG